MGKLIGIVDMVQSAIENGARSVEEVQREIAKKPFEMLKSIEQIEPTVTQVESFHDQTIGNIYDMIRKLNTEAATVAKDLLSKIETPEGQ
jgi:hypothetical protein